MKPEQFEGNTQYMRYEYHRVREGPNYFVSFYKNSSRLHYDPKECWRVLGTAKFTESGKALKQWAVEMYESNLPKPEPIADTSFASEAMEEPNDNTRMVT